MTEIYVTPMSFFLFSSFMSFLNEFESKIILGCRYILNWQQDAASFLQKEHNAKGKGKESVTRSVLSDSVQLHGLSPTRLLCPWDSPGKSTGVGCHSLLQGIFLTQGLNLDLLYCSQIL